MRLYQLADCTKTYDNRAGWWMVVSDDSEEELAGPFEIEQEAADWIESMLGNGCTQ
jgi:xanthine/CO dehydrogenase XdhC/CoxF family maturation factor